MVGQSTLLEVAIELDPFYANTIGCSPDLFRGGATIMTKPLDRKVDRSNSPRIPHWAYLDGRVVAYREASFDLLTHALNYGTGMFAGIRGYWNAAEQQLFVFRPEDHFRRFCDSARLLRMELRFTPDDLTAGVIELLRAEEYRENCYIRPLAFYGD